MKYKHKFTIGDSLDIAYPVHGRIKTEEAQLEMAEVYRKAEAFDEIKDYLSRRSPIDEDRDEVQKIIDEYDKEDVTTTLYESGVRR